MVPSYRVLVPGSGFWVSRFCAPIPGLRTGKNPRTRNENPVTRNPEPGTRSLYVCFVPRLSQLQPIERIFHQQLAGAFERVILSLRMTLPVLRHQNASAIRMAGEVHAEHVE